MATDSTQYLAMGTTGIILFLVIFVVGVLLGALILWLVAKLFKLKANKFKTALITSAVAAVINQIVSFATEMSLGKAIGASTSASLLVSLGTIVVGYVVNSLSIKQFYKIETGKAFLVGLVWLVLSIAAMFVVALIIGVIVVAILFGIGSGALTQVITQK